MMFRSYTTIKVMISPPQARENFETGCLLFLLTKGGGGYGLCLLFAYLGGWGGLKSRFCAYVICARSLKPGRFNLSSE